MPWSSFNKILTQLTHERHQTQVELTPLHSQLIFKPKIKTLTQH